MRDNSSLSISIILLGLVVIITAVMLTVHMLQSLEQAVNALETCKTDGLVDCHIERDGLDYNVYGKEE